MRVLVVGGGAREHAFVWRLVQNPTIDRIYAAPGNAGIAREATCLSVRADDVPAIVEAVQREGIDLTIVGPEAPLVAGLADELESRGHAVFGPNAAAARIEGSKAWAKQLCEHHGIPAARSRAFTEIVPAVAHLESLGDVPVVVKADGLAGGKGVTVAEDRATAVAALEAALVGGVFGAAGSSVLIEEFLQGREVSAFALCDGSDMVPLVFAQDFKRIGDGDAGPNTGGMGAYSPLPFLDDEAARAIEDGILRATVRAMDAEGVRYRGLLYAGIMLTAEGPKVLEFNCRFGDPETEVVVPRMRGDLGELLLSCCEGNLANYRVEWTDDACVTVVLASGGYPGRHETGKVIHGLDEAAEVEGAVVFHAGTQERDGKVVSAGGRVLAVSALGASLAQARDRAYDAAGRISFEGMQYRTDIAARAAKGE
jgi:phosphoribosylamine--glycine ligase